MSRNAELNLLMVNHNKTARQIGEIVGRKPHTVRCWRSSWKGREIPEHTLAFLKTKLAEPSA